MKGVGMLPKNEMTEEDVKLRSNARRFYGIKYSLAAARFNSAFAARRENEMWFAERR